MYVKLGRNRGVMKPSRRIWPTNEALGIASILQVAATGAYNLEQDLKGRWHVWSAPVTKPNSSDHTERHLAGDIYG